MERQMRGNEMWIVGNNVEWKPQLNALLRYGGWMTTIQEFWINGHGSIVGMPKNFVEELLLHLTNSRSTRLMLPQWGVNIRRGSVPIPPFIDKLFNEKWHFHSLGRPIHFDAIDLRAEDGQIFHIFDGKMKQCFFNSIFELTLIMANKWSGDLFEVEIRINRPKKCIIRIEFKNQRGKPAGS